MVFKKKYFCFILSRFIFPFNGSLFISLLVQINKKFNKTKDQSRATKPWFLRIKRWEFWNPNPPLIICLWLCSFDHLELPIMCNGSFHGYFNEFLSWSQKFLESVWIVLAVITLSMRWFGLERSRLVPSCYFVILRFVLAYINPHSSLLAREKELRKDCLVKTKKSIVVSL